MPAETVKRQTLQHGGVCLPVYPTNQVAWRKADIVASVRAAQAEGLPSFTRVIRMPENPDFIFRSLGHLVTEARTNFEQIADFTGTTLIDYLLGFSPLPNTLNSDERRMTHNQLLPRGYGLIAEVDIVHNVDKINNWDANAILRGLMRYRLSGTSRFEIADMFRDNPADQMYLIGEQFTVGNARNSVGPSSVHLTDVDHYVYPRF